MKTRRIVLLLIIFFGVMYGLNALVYHIHTPYDKLNILIDVFICSIVFYGLYYLIGITDIISPKIRAFTKGTPHYFVDKAQIFFFPKHPSTHTIGDVLNFAAWCSKNNIYEPTEDDFQTWKREANFEFQEIHTFKSTL